MIETKQEYQNYKECEIGWINEIPENWQTPKLKFITNCLDSERIPLNAEERSEIEGDIPYYGANGVVDYVNDYIFDDEIILLGEDGAPFHDPYKNVAFKVDEKCWVNNHAHILKTNDSVNSDFLVYALNLVKYPSLLSGSTRDKLTQSDMGNIRVVLPPKKEQQKIANYLDQKTSKIDKLIEKNNKLIELLKEKRQAIITKAVTKGIDENVEMKDSGVEWIGEIPEGWDVTAIKYLLNVKDGTHESPEYISESNNSFPLITSKNLTSGEVDLDDANFVSKEDYLKYSARGKAEKDDVLMPMIGTLGNPVIVENDNKFVIKNVALFKTSKSDRINQCYLKFLLESNLIKKQFNLKQAGGVQSFLSLGVLRNLQIPVVSIKEQNKIVNFLQNKVESIDKIIRKLNTENKKLEEYKKTLISKVVTGKIKV